MTRTRLHLALVAVTAAALATGITLAMVSAGAPSKPLLPGVGLDPTQAAKDIEAARTAVSAPQNTFLDDFNSGRRSTAHLQRGELEAEVLQPAGVDGTVGEATAVVLATASRVYFHGSGMQDIPGATITYTVDRTFKGPLAVGRTFDLDFLGGPYKQPTGEEIFLEVSLEPIDSVGEASLLMLKQLDSGHWDVVSIGGKLRLADGKVEGMPAGSGWTSEWTGRSEKDLLDHVAAITK